MQELSGNWNADEAALKSEISEVNSRMGKFSG
jgi:hypothetical protein